MKGKFFGIGVGPGDEKLLTIKAAEILGSVDIVAFPKSSENKDSTAFNIVKNYVGCDTRLLELVMPMTNNPEVLESCRKEAADVIAQNLDDGHSVAFITLGDPAFYSTYTYLHKYIAEKGYEIEIIPGITSFSASAAVACGYITEGDEVFAIVPGTAEMGRIREVIQQVDSAVLMKVSANFPMIMEFLREEKLLDKAFLVERCSMQGQKIIFDLTNYSETPGYFSTMIVRKS